MTPWLRAGLLVLCIALPPAAFAAVPEVFVEPFALYNAPDLDGMAQGLQSMMASRLGGEGYTVRTRGDAPTTAGDWVVRTSITRLGGIYSLDAALAPATGSAEGSRSYQTADGMEALVPALDQVAEHLRSALTDILRVSQDPATASQPAPAPPPSAAKPVGQVVPATPAVGDLAAPPPGTNAAEGLQGAFQRQRVSPELTGEATSIAVGDVDGDGHDELLVLVAKTIAAFRDVGGEIRQVWDSAIPSGFSPMTLSIGEIDGVGTPEVFVAGIRSQSPTTQALEWSGSALTPKGERVPGFLRAVPHPEHGVLLLGMGASVGHALFAPGIHRYLWGGAGYVEGSRFPVSERAIGVNLDFLRLGTQNQVITVITTQNNELQGLDGNDGILFTVEGKVKGSRVQLMGEETASGYMDEDVVWISGRTLAYRSPAGRDYLLVYKNASGLGRMFKRSISSLSNGQVLAYNWDGVGLSPGPVTSSYAGFVADVGLATVTGARSSTLYVAVVRTDTGLFNAPLTRLVAYDLP
ncbi:MAG TPA: VCBS repeat-containing protein [Deferrisomatales bacterium]|nr:VCBS repeat-containing protein [Deferrisomatales bacterium]